MPSVARTTPGRFDRRIVAPALFAASAAIVVVVHLATNATLGFHTDELYYLDCGRHLALGYVDFPPVLPLLARVETALLGTTPWSLRVLPTLAGGFMVVLSGLYVRKLGGSLRMQAIALLIAVTAPYFLGANWVFQTVTFDQATWMVSLYWFLSLAMERRPRHWIYLGVSLGVGLEVKYTIAGLVLGVIAAILVTPSLRAALRTRHPWLGAAAALVIWAPNLLWQVAEGFPSLAYVGNHSGSGGGPLIYLLELGVYLFFLIPLWVAGMAWLFRSPTLRAVGVACAVPLVLFLFVGKSYYAAGTVPVTLAAGLVAVSQVRRARLRTGLEIAAVAAALLELVTFVQVTLPITPADRLHAAGLDAKNEVFADSVGWEDVAHQVSAIYAGLPAQARSSTVIVSAYYGVPGALAIYGDQAQLPVVVSPQLTDWYWLPANVSATQALMVDYAPSDVSFMCGSATVLTHLVVPYHVQGLEQGAPVTLCTLDGPLSTYWGRLRNFS